MYNVAGTPVQESLVSFGKRLRHARQQLGLSGAELAARLGLERSAIPQYEAGRTFPSVAVLKKLTRILGISIDRLLFDEYEVTEEIQDKELVGYFRRIDRLDGRERSMVKMFLDSILAREELEEMKRAARQSQKAA